MASKLSRRIGGLAAAIVLGIAGMGVLATPALAAASFQIGNTSPSSTIQLVTGYTEEVTSTVEIRNNGDVDGTPQCEWTSPSNAEFTTKCPTSIPAGGIGSATVTVPTGWATGYYSLNLSVGDTTRSVLSVTVGEAKALTGVTISSNMTGTNVDSPTESPIGSTLYARPVDAYPTDIVTYQWYCGTNAITGQTETVYQPVSTDVSCDPGISVQATMPGADPRMSKAVKIMVGDVLNFQNSDSQTIYSQPWNLVPGYTAADRVKTVKLANTGTIDIDISKISCEVQEGAYNPMNIDLTQSRTTGTLPPNSSIDLTLTADPDLPAATSIGGSVVCTTDNLGRASLYTSLTVNPPVLSGVTIRSNGTDNPAQAPVAQQLSAVPSDDAYPPDAVTYQWFCGSDPISDQTSSTYTPVMKDQSCTPGIIVKAAVGTITAQSQPVKIVVGDQISLSRSLMNFPLIAGYDAAAQAQTSSLTNNGTATILLSDLTCGFVQTTPTSMKGAIDLPKDVTSIAPYESITLTVTPEEGLAVGVSKSGQVSCTTKNFGSASIATSATVKDASSLSGVTITAGSSNESVTESSVGTALWVTLPPDAFPLNATTYQWYCGSDKITQSNSSVYRTSVTDVACKPGISVDVTVATGTPAEITKKSTNTVKVVYGDQLSASPDSLIWALVAGYDATKEAKVVELTNAGITDILPPLSCEFQTDSTYTMKGSVNVDSFTAIAPTSTVKVTVTPEGDIAAGTSQFGRVVCSTEGGGSVTIYTPLAVSDAPSLGTVSLYDPSPMRMLNPDTGTYNISLAQVGDSVQAGLAASQVVSNGDVPLSWKWFCDTTELGTGSVASDQLSSIWTVQPDNVGCDLSAQAFMTVDGQEYSSTPSRTLEVASLSLTYGGSNYPNYPYPPSWQNLDTKYNVSDLNLGSLIFTNWGTTAVNDLSCILPDNTDFTVVTQPASIAPKNSTVMQLKPVAGLPAQNTSQNVICTDEANGLRIFAAASIEIVDTLSIEDISLSEITPQVGQTVDAKATVLPATATSTYEWFCQMPDGTTPAAKSNTGATSYIVTADDIGCNLGVKVTATDNGATVSRSITGAAVPAVSVAGADSWSDIPVGYTAADLKSSDTVTIKNNGKEPLTIVSYQCPTDVGLKCVTPPSSTLAPGDSATVTISPELGLAQGTYDGTFSVTYMENGRPVTLNEGVGITVGSAPAIDWVEPTNGTPTPLPPDTGNNGGSGGSGGTGGSGDNGTGGTGGTGGNGGTGGTGGNGTTANGGSGKAPGTGTVGPNANGTTPKKIDTGGTANNDSTGIALLGLGFIAMGVLILKRRAA